MVVALVRITSLIFEISVTSISGGLLSFGIVTQQSAVGSAQDLNSLQLFLPHLKGELTFFLQKERELTSVIKLEKTARIIREGYRLTKVNFVHVYSQIPLLWSNIRLLV